jgi:hypothetical protein
MIAERQPVITQDVAIVPEFLNDYRRKLILLKNPSSPFDKAQGERKFR